MMNDISGYGIAVNVNASVTFPGGFSVSMFADDADPFDAPSQEVGAAAMGLNGDMVGWSRANPLMITINVIPNSEDDRNLSALLEANRPGRGKAPAGDVVTMTAIYPDGSTVTHTQGMILSGTPSNSIASAGRMKSKAYNFAFENRVVS